jgi:hypothetical protein
MSQNTGFGNYQKERTIITTEETTIITHENGEYKSYGKFSFINLPARPPKISAPNDKEFVNVVIVSWKSTSARS